MSRDELLEFLRENLTLDVDTKSEYVGDMHGGGSLYQDRHTLKLMLGDEVISEAYL